MNAREILRAILAGANRFGEAPLGDLTEDQFNYAPSGTANTISATLIHYAGSEDNFVQHFIQGKPRVWETGGWAAKVGLPNPPGRGEDWTATKSKRLALAPARAYAAAVRATTVAYIDSVTDADLERVIDFRGEPRRVVDLLCLALAQAIFHSGEISNLKGIQGAKGIPF